MNLSKLFEMQRELDERIMDEHPELKGQNNLDWKILALQVELGECANEWRGFKKWSKDQEARIYEECHVCNGHGKTMVPSFPSFDDFEQEICPVCQGEGVTGKNPLLEEYVDCLHFILSIGLEKWNGYDYELKSVRERFLTDQFNWLFRKVGDFSQYPTKGNYFWIINIFVGLGEMLGFTWEQIEQAYFQKNVINHKRQEAGY